MDFSVTIFSSSSSSPKPLSIVLVDFAELSRFDLSESELEFKLLWLPFKLSTLDCFTRIVVEVFLSVVAVFSCLSSSGDDFKFSFSSVGIGTTTLDVFEAEHPIFDQALQCNKRFRVKYTLEEIFPCSLVSEIANRHEM